MYNGLLLSEYWHDPNAEAMVSTVTPSRQRPVVCVRRSIFILGMLILVNALIDIHFYVTYNNIYSMMNILL